MKRTYLFSILLFLSVYVSAQITEEQDQPNSLPNLTTTTNAQKALLAALRKESTHDFDALFSKDILPIMFPEKIMLEKFSKKYNQKLKDFKRDTLNIKSEGGNLKPNAHFILNSATPLVKTDKSKIKILRKDSTAVAFSTQYDDWKQQLALVFDKDEKQTFVIHVEPDALTDFYDKTNKALKYTVTTGALSDYGNLRVTLENAKRFPVIVELTSQDGKVLETAYSDGSKIVTFENIQPNKYTMRLIYDDNKNHRWDPGNYLENRQSEEVIYFPKELDVRANWDVEQPFDLKISN